MFESPMLFPMLAPGFSISLFPRLEGCTELRELNLRHLLMEWLTFNFLEQGTVIEVAKNVGHKATLWDAVGYKL